jgi:hypothetical protein
MKIVIFLLLLTLTLKADFQSSGVVSVKHGDLKMENCSFTDNSVEFNCIDIDSSEVVAYGLLLYGNRSRNGSMVSSVSTTGEIHLSTIYGNSSSDGISLANSSSFKLYNSIIRENGNEEITLSGGSNIDVKYSNIMGGYSGEGNIDEDPEFSSEEFFVPTNDLCINSGNIELSPDYPYFDLVGSPRLYEDEVEMGALEVAYGNSEPTLPKTTQLFQNYPNPFNPVTTISFNLVKDQFITLDIYNIKGERVTQLAKGNFSLGKHLLKWDGNGVSSGVYFYKLRAGSYQKTMRAVLLK